MTESERLRTQQAGAEGTSRCLTFSSGWR